jgi:hypothetical protein
MEAGAAADANALLLEAREEAARILADARAQAASSQGEGGASTVAPGGAATLGPFISRERRFLQGLADLIQSHAEAVKQDLRRARGSAPVQGPGPEAPVSPPSDVPGPSEAVSDSPATDIQTAEGAIEEGGPQESAEIVQEGGTQWTQYYGAPASAAQVSHGAMAGDDEIVDLTQESESPGAAISGDAESTRNPGPAEPPEEDDTDRSLRELFWGED